MANYCKYCLDRTEACHINCPKYDRTEKKKEPEILKAEKRKSTITTLHDVDDEVHFRLFDKDIERKGYVSEINVTKTAEGTTITYRIDCRDGRYTVTEDELC